MLTLSVDEHGARATHLDAAAVFGAGQAEQVTQHPKQRHAFAAHGNITIDSINIQRELGHKGKGRGSAFARRRSAAAGAAKGGTRRGKNASPAGALFGAPAPDGEKILHRPAHSAFFYERRSVSIFSRHHGRVAGSRAARRTAAAQVGDRWQPSALIRLWDAASMEPKDECRMNSRLIFLNPRRTKKCRDRVPNDAPKSASSGSWPRHDPAACIYDFSLSRLS